jgi:hypothetical protein
MTNRLLLFLGLSAWLITTTSAQIVSDSVSNPQPQTLTAWSGLRAKHYIAPLLLVGAGLATQGAISRDVQRQVQARYPGFELTLDDYAQYAPTAVVLGLGAAGVQGKHRFGDQLALTALSHVVAQGITQSLKRIVAYPRPDGFGNDAFPSGHTTFAFTGAAVLAHEYGGRSVWYVIGGYATATATGGLRILNDRHWLADVLTGAGIGIAATELVYQTYPWLKKVVFRRKNAVLLPVYAPQYAGFYGVVRF